MGQLFTLFESEGTTGANSRSIFPSRLRGENMYVQPQGSGTPATFGVQLQAKMHPWEYFLASDATPATAGTFTLDAFGGTTAAIAFDATAQDVQDALEALTEVGAGNATVKAFEGANLGQASTRFGIMFDRSLMEAAPVLATGTTYGAFGGLTGNAHTTTTNWTDLISLDNANLNSFEEAIAQNTWISISLPLLPEMRGVLTTSGGVTWSVYING